MVQIKLSTAGWKARLRQETKTIPRAPEPFSNWKIISVGWSIEKLTRAYANTIAPAPYQPKNSINFSLY